MMFVYASWFTYCTVGNFHMMQTFVYFVCSIRMQKYNCEILNMLTTCVTFDLHTITACKAGAKRWLMSSCFCKTSKRNNLPDSSGPLSTLRQEQSQRETHICVASSKKLWLGNLVAIRRFSNQLEVELKVTCTSFQTWRTRYFWCWHAYAVS